jgi:hypothetical protein
MLQPNLYTITVHKTVCIHQFAQIVQKQCLEHLSHNALILPHARKALSETLRKSTILEVPGVSQTTTSVIFRKTTKNQN